MTAIGVLPSFVSRGRGLPQRWVVAAAAAVAHAPVIGPHLEEAPYMGALFAVLTAVCAFLAIAAVVRDTGIVYALTGLTCGWPSLATWPREWWRPRCSPTTWATG